MYNNYDLSKCEVREDKEFRTLITPLGDKMDFDKEDKSVSFHFANTEEDFMLSFEQIKFINDTISYLERKNEG